MAAPEPTRWVGIDAAKGHLDIAVRPSGERWRVANAEPAWAELVARLQERPRG